MNSKEGPRRGVGRRGARKGCREDDGSSILVMSSVSWQIGKQRESGGGIGDRGDWRSEEDARLKRGCVAIACFLILEG